MPQRSAVFDGVPATQRKTPPGFNRLSYAWKLDELRALLQEDGHRAVARCSLPPLTQTMTYALSGGQCLRGLLLLAVADSCGASRKQAREAATAVEMLHAASLVVDDLPALDNTSLRRGALSVHKRFGDAAAILTAHALVAAAFEVVTQIASSPEQLLQITQLLARAIGGCRMARAELVDGNASGRQETDILAAKTGSLFQAATQIAALLANADPTLAAQLGNFGLQLGICYQLVDDIRDQPSDVNREALITSGQLCWNRSLQLFEQVRAELRDTIAIEVWLSNFYDVGAEMLTIENESGSRQLG
jgi:geranylgeranyl pyrophosphate synthase